MSTRTKWTAIERPDSDVARVAAEDEARISQFRELVFRVRTEAGLTQADLARRMGTTQSAIARVEGGGARPSLDALVVLCWLLVNVAIFGALHISALHQELDDARRARQCRRGVE